MEANNRMLVIALLEYQTSQPSSANVAILFNLRLPPLLCNINGFLAFLMYETNSALQNTDTVDWLSKRITSFKDYFESVNYFITSPSTLTCGLLTCCVSTLDQKLYWNIDSSISSDSDSWMIWCWKQILLCKILTLLTDCPKVVHLSKITSNLWIVSLPALQHSLVDCLLAVSPL